MKRFILLSCLILLSANAFAKDKSEFDIYKLKLDNCQKHYQEQQKQFTMNKFDSRSAHTLKMIELAKSARTCYVNVGYEVIDTFYSIKNKDVKKSFDNYIYSSNNVAFNMYENPDICVKIRGCGLLAQQFYIETTSFAIGNMVNEIIRGAKTMSSWGN